MMPNAITIIVQVYIFNSIFWNLIMFLVFLFLRTFLNVLYRVACNKPRTIQPVSVSIMFRLEIKNTRLYCMQ
jgi:hypothetical protein